LCAQNDLARAVTERFELHHQIGRRQLPGHFVGPLSQFQASAGEDVAKTGVFPFLRVVEAVKVKVPDRQIGQFIRLDHRIRWAFDAPLHTQRAQQVAHQRGFASAQVAAQFNEGVMQRGLAGQRLRKALCGSLVRPDKGFYNGQVNSFRTHNEDEDWVFRIRGWARELGFSQIGVSGVDLSSAEPGLSAWLAANWHGEMTYMAAHGLKRARPAELQPGTLSVVTARMDYLPVNTPAGWQTRELGRLQQTDTAIVSIYARGRDYHKVMRQRLQKLADQMVLAMGPLGHRVFTDSAPVLEAELASRSGLGWRGKHTLVLNREAGSMAFLGEIFVDVALTPTEAVSSHCGNCSACLAICPTQAIVAPYRLDARRCLSYLSIEHAGPIPEAFRAAMGNRIYGCDDCQLVCPWNKFATSSRLPDFDARPHLVDQPLARVFAWTEDEFLRFTEGSPIRRIGHERWLRNVAVALGNALRAASSVQAGADLTAALHSRLTHPSALVREHVTWALAQAHQA